METPEISAADGDATPAVSVPEPAPAVRTPIDRTTAWALHSFGYRAGLPALPTFRARLIFEVSKKILIVSLPAEPVGSPGQLVIAPIGPARAVFSVIADAPIVTGRSRVLAVEVEIEGLRAGAITFMARDEVSPERSHSIILGDPMRFTYDRQERLAIRNAVWKVEDKYLSGEMTRQTIPGLHPDLLLESDATRRVADSAAFGEICRQLVGAVRADTWGYLWNRSDAPTVNDGSALAMSDQMTVSMAQHLHAVAETLLRSCGAKPLKGGFETGTDMLDTVAYALVAMRSGVDVKIVAKPVLAAIHRYGRSFDLQKLRRPTE